MRIKTESMTGKKPVTGSATKEEEETGLSIRMETGYAMKGKVISGRKGGTGEEEMGTGKSPVYLYAFRLLGPVLIVILLTGTAQAQFSISTGFNLSYNDNINNNYEFLSDEVTELFLEGSYNFSSKNKSFELYYTGSFDYYRRNVNRTFHEHSAGFAYSGSFGKKLNSSLSLGGAYLLSLNREDYSYLDYNGASAFANYKTYIGKRTSWQLGYNFNYYKYNEIQEFNNLQNYLYSSVTGYLPSRTTLSFEAGFGLKTYLNSLAVTSTSQMGSRMHRMGNSTVIDESVTRLDVSGRLSQAIFDRTGLGLRAGYTKNLSSNERFLISGNVSGTEGTLDDEYSFEGPFAEISLTQHIPGGIAAVLSAGYQHRNYIDRPAYDINENIVSEERIDKLVAASVSLIKNFENLGIQLSYNYIQNSTNDGYYNFKNNIFSLELGAGF